ncbi:MAG: 4-hydroxythreonine-4-phosphate dehydrogenase PdxA [Rhodothermales bacterium]
MTATSHTTPAGRLRPRIGITLGDPNGIGPEVVLKALADPRLRKFVEPVLIGPLKLWAHHAEQLGLHDVSFYLANTGEADSGRARYAVLEPDVDPKPVVELGKITEHGGRYAMRAVECAVDGCLDGSLDAMVTAPISKEAIDKAGYRYPGHTEFIAERTNSNGHTMMMVAQGLRVGLVTGHIPVWEVPQTVTEAAIREKISIIHASLITDFGIATPRIAVLGLNPHAGDGGVLGTEELDTITPTVQALREEGKLVFGPFPADGFFGTRSDRQYDAVLAMYHDQGLIPFKALTFNSGVNFTAGLPIIRTSPDHGTAYSLAGQGKASPDSMRQALYAAIDISRRRNAATTTEAT